MLWISCLLLFLLAESSSSAKILGGSAIGGSHYLMMRNVMEELASRGHEVCLPFRLLRKIYKLLIHILQWSVGVDFN